jgi:hypothetical protein
LVASDASIEAALKPVKVLPQGHCRRGRKLVRRPLEGLPAHETEQA